MTQEQSVQKLYVSFQMGSKWERDAKYPEKFHLVRLSEIFGVSVYSLIIKIA